MDVDVVALNAVKTKLEQLQDRCKSGILQPGEFRPVLEQLDREARAILPTSSDAFRHYDRKFNEHRTVWTKQTFSGYVDVSDCGQIAHRLDAVREALKRLTPEFLKEDFSERAEFYYPEGDRFHATQTLYHLLKRAVSSLDIVDGYLDNEVFDFLEAIDTAVAIRLVLIEHGLIFAETPARGHIDRGGPNQRTVKARAGEAITRLRTGN